VFEANDPLEQQVSYARPLVDVVVRADTAVDPAIREQQLASKGNPTQPGLEPPAGSAYEVRYLKQVEGIQRLFGRIGVDEAQQIAREIAPDSNVQSVVYAWPEVWIANASGTTPAAHRPYRRLAVDELLQAP
jgi:hypothetical protein